MRLGSTLVGLVVVLTLVLSSTVYAGFAFHKSDLVADERADVNETAAVAAHDLETRLDASKRSARVAAGAPALQRHGSPAQSAALRDFLGASTFDAASVVARNGTVTAVAAPDAGATERERLAGSNVAEAPSVRAALDGRLAVSEPFRAESGTYVVVVSAPIRNESGVVGALNAALHLRPPAAGQRSPFTDLAHIVGPSESVSVRDGETTLYRSGTHDDRTFRATEGVGNTDWTVVVERDRGKVARQVRDVTFVQGAALLVVLCSVGALGYWTYRANIQQIAALRRGLAALEAGEYDVDVALSGTEEWNEVGERFERVGSHLQQREGQLRVLNRVLRHNLRNEMNVVLGHAQTIQDDDADAAAHAAAVETAASEVLQISRQARLIEDRLRPSNGTPEPGAIDVVVDGAVATAKDLADVTVVAPDDVVVVDADAIETALRELVSNAIVHNPAPPDDREVAITVSDHDDHVRVRIADNGPGLPDVERELLTGDRDASPVEHGEGLGLWVVRWLVDRVGGTITATVTDDGTTVTLTVPKVYTGDER